MKNRFEHENACQRVASRFHSRPLSQYVVHKLRSDPAYPAVYEAIRSSSEPLLDVGCGVGLLEFYLRERGLENPIIGLDRDLRKIRVAQQIASAYPEVDLRAQDVRGALTKFSGNIALVDILHYLSPADQEDLLSRLAECVAPGAILVLRDCPRDGGIRYLATVLAEKLAQLIWWNVSTSLHFPEREAIMKSFSPDEFERDVKSCWGKTPYNNHLFTFRRQKSATASTSE